MEKLIARHRMQSDTGAIYEVLEFQKFIDAGTFDDPHATVPGLKRLALASGGHVNHIDDDTFKIVATGEIIRKA